MTNAQKLDLIIEMLQQRSDNRDTVRHIAEQIQEIKVALRDQNVLLREQNSTIAEYGQWIRDHEEQTHLMLCERINGISRRANLMGSLNATLTAVMAGIVTVWNEMFRK